MQSVIELIDRLLLLQFSVGGMSPRETFPTLMSNRLAAGYVFGFHDACFRIFGLVDPNNRAAELALIEERYKRIFGEQAGFAFVQSALDWQLDREFTVGWESGGEDFVEFKLKGTPTLGLQRILSLGFDNSMVEHTLKTLPK